MYHNHPELDVFESHLNDPILSTDFVTVNTSINLDHDGYGQYPQQPPHNQQHNDFYSPNDSPHPTSTPAHDEDNDNDDRGTLVKIWDFFFNRPEPLLPRTVHFHPMNKRYTIELNTDPKAVRNEYPRIRSDWVDTPDHPGSFSPNVIKNTKYTVLKFIPIFLYNEFRFFFNLYFLLVALSQFITPLQVGFLFTYVSPLCMVLGVSMCKEIYDDLKRYHRDTIANNEEVEVYVPSQYDKHEPIENYTTFSPATLSHATNAVELSSITAKSTSNLHEVLTENVADIPTVKIPSSQLTVGDIVLLKPEQRVPADCLLLKAFDKTSTAYIVTADLDGETDFKLRRPPQCLTRNFHKYASQQQQGEFVIAAEAPKLDIYDFKGNITIIPKEGWKTPANGEKKIEGLSLDNTLWANTTVASSPVLAMVLYTGKDSRSALNANQPTTKTGALDMEVNKLSKILFLLTIALALIMVLVKGAPFNSLWFIFLFRFVLLFSSIIPISLRVNLDMAKMFYSYQINNDTSIPGTSVRTSTIPEELGRCSYLFSDKTGTLTTNTMKMKVIQLKPPHNYNTDSFQLLKHHIAQTFANERPNASNSNVSDPVLSDFTFDDLTATNSPGIPSSPIPGVAASSNSLADIKHLMNAIALCHSVTPTSSGAESDNNSIEYSASHAIQVEHNEKQQSSLLTSLTPSALGVKNKKNQLPSSSTTTNPNGSTLEDTTSTEDENPKFQAASPDEVAIVTFCADVGLTLTQRDSRSMTIATPFGDEITYNILSIFPFTSQSKRMGIVVQRAPSPSTNPNEENSNDILFFLKGAESVIIPKCKPNTWVNEEVDSLARIGLRTLVYASRTLTPADYQNFDQKYTIAKSSLNNREELIQQCIEEYLEVALDCIGVIAVEDQLQPRISESLQLLRNAGIFIWLLTGDKVETAVCIAKSTRLVDRSQKIIQLQCNNRSEAALVLDMIDFKSIRQSALLVDGSSLQILLDNFPSEFLDVACLAPSVICCRCSPLQKSLVVTKMKKHTGKRCAAIGDGSNDCPMILSSDVGIGIEGKEGSRASMAADFSITEFSHIVPLILWHGRNSYKRSAALSQFIMHRGMIISIIQAVFSALYFFVAIPIYTGWLMVGYTTVYTMLPVFSLVSDTDVTRQTAFTYPELYSALQRDKPLSIKSFFIWVLLSLYQGFIIFATAAVLFTQQFINIVSITFTALIFCELLNVVLSVSRLNKFMVFSILGSLFLYIVSIFALTTYFDITFVLTFEFLYKTVLITLVAVLPPAFIGFIAHRLNPADHAKITN